MEKSNSIAFDFEMSSFSDFTHKNNKKVMQPSKAGKMPRRVFGSEPQF